MNQLIYMDNMASTPIAPEVKESILQSLDLYANPSSNNHVLAYQAHAAIENARINIAKHFNTKAENWIFTSGATESINLAIQGIAHSYKRRSTRIITFASEHSATLKCCKSLRSYGFDVEILPVEKNGLINLNQLEDALKTPTLLVSVLHVNNEIGVIQDLDSISKLTQKYNALLHVDGAQTPGKTMINLIKNKINLFSVSGHKVYGPKGSGALYIAPEPKIILEPLLYGGHQESGLRPGTLATHQIIGLSKALQLADHNYSSDLKRIKDFHKQIMNTLNKLNNISINGDLIHRVPHNINITFKDYNFSQVKTRLNNFAFSPASACTKAALRPSHVLLALGHSHLEANNTIRISLGRYTTSSEVNNLCTQLQANFS